MDMQPKPQERRVCAAPDCTRAVPASRSKRVKTCCKACAANLRAWRMRGYNKASRARKRAANAIAHDTRAAPDYAQTADMPAQNAVE